MSDWVSVSFETEKIRFTKELASYKIFEKGTNRKNYKLLSLVKQI